MNGDHRRVRIRATDGTPPLMLLGGNHHGGQGGVLLRRLIQGIQWVHTGQPAVSHHIQYGGRCGNLPLINRSGRGGKDTREVWEGIAEDDKTILHRQRASILTPYGQTSRGRVHPGGYLRQVGTMKKCGQDGCHGTTIMSHLRQPI